MTKKVKVIIIALAVLLVASIIALAVPLGIYVDKAKDNRTRINGIYEKSYYSCMDSLENISTKLSKVNVVSGTTIKREILNDVWKNSDIAVDNFAQLGKDSNETEKVVKFLNQLGDYCYYLSGKVSSDKDLSIDEKENIKRFYALVNELKIEFAKIGESLETDKAINADTLSDLTAFTKTIKNYSSIDYPELIYDGPFSDGLNDRTTKFLEGKSEISEKDAENRIKSYFSDAKNIELVGEGKASLESYVISFETNKRTATAFITKKGGYLVNYNNYMEIDEPVKTEAECIEKAKEFLIKTGYTDMECVWTYNNNSTVYLNFAYKKGNVIFYPDLIKVKVSAQNGEIIGFEAQNYIYNHGERDIEFDNSAEGAIKVSSLLEVEKTAYCVIPTDWNEEVYCKEVKGTYENLTYYLYYDLSTGEEIRALVVIDEDGDKLI